MLTRIEIDGFKTFENFSLDLQPLSAIVGPNASGKSNLFDAIKFIALLAQFDVRTAMQDLRGEPEELFRRTDSGTASEMSFAIEVLLDPNGTDAFGTRYEIKSQRLRYEVSLHINYSSSGMAQGIHVSRESCRAIAKKEDRGRALSVKKIGYSSRLKPFISMKETSGHPVAFEIRQDGPAGDTGATKRGRPVTLPAVEASRTALSTIATAEFPHLYGLKDLLTSIRFLEISPQAARRASDRFESRTLKPDASNLAAVLARLKDETADSRRPSGVIADISADLSSLIPSVRSVEVFNDEKAKEYSFSICTSDILKFSSRVISDGTLRLLSLLAILDDPKRRGILCFEEPENGVHEGRIASLVQLLRDAVAAPEIPGEYPLFQILVNTHSPAVMAALTDEEIIAADAVSIIDPISKTKSVKTRMRTGIHSGLDLNPEADLSRQEIGRLLKRQNEEA